MPITSISISSEKLDLDNPSSIAIGEPIPYSIDIEIDDDVDVYVVVSIRRKSDDSIEETRRHRVIGDDPDSIIIISDLFSKTHDLITSCGLINGANGDGVGKYYLYAEVEGDEAVNTGTDLIFYVVMMTPWMVQNTIFAGIPFVNFNDQPIDPILIERGIEIAMSSLETDMGFTLCPIRVVTRGKGNPNPDPSSYDRLVDPVTFKEEHSYGFRIRLKHSYVSEVTSAKLYYGTEMIFEVPDEWINVRWKPGHVRIMHVFKPTPQGIIAFNFFALMRSRISDGWYFNYKAGWDETLQPYPADIINGLQIYLTIQIGDIVGDALSPGISSSSISLDGVSASIGTTASAIYNLLSSKVDAAKHKKKEWLPAFEKRYRPTTIGFLGD